MIKNEIKILIFGMHCSGKTTFGRLLAEHVKCAFIDTDEKIAETVGMSVRSFYLINGKKAFQEIEYEVFADCLSMQTTNKHLVKNIVVISVGGGLIENEKARLMLREKQKAEPNTIKVFFLDVPKNILFNRLLRRTKREKSFPAFLSPYINKNIKNEIQKNIISFSQLKSKRLGLARKKFFKINKKRSLLLKSIEYIKLKTKREKLKRLFNIIKQNLLN